jgi:hypothetical protein
MTVTKRLRLRFRDSNDRIVSFTINPPAEPVNLADVEELMDLIISTDLFYTYTGGQIVEKVDAALHTAEVEPVGEFE